MNNDAIGVFDSGVGGLSIFAELNRILPNEDFLYFGDTANLPYGNKTKEELVEITKNIFDYFRTRNVKAVVMACNTTSAVTYDIIRNEYDFKIYPLVQNVSESIASEGWSKIGVFATKATINSHAYKRELQFYNPNTEVFEVACPEWVQIVENSLMYEISSIGNIKLYINKMLEKNPEKIILGCTHYPYLMEILSRFASADIFINPAKYFAEYIYNDLNNSGLLNNERNYEPKFYVSANSSQFKQTSKLFYDVDVVSEITLEKSLV